MELSAVIKNPEIISSMSGNYDHFKIKGGIKCRLVELPAEPESKAIVRNGEWLEQSVHDSIPCRGSRFIIALDGSDNASSQLLNILRENKKIGEIVVYDVNLRTGNAVFGYYFNNILVEKATMKTKYKHQKVLMLNCICTSFKQRDSNNNESVLWDWVTNTHRYTGATV